MPVVAVVDTSVLVSAFLNPEGFPARVLAAAQRRRFTLVTSAPLLEELREVLSRPRLTRARNTTPADADVFVQSIADAASQVPVSDTLQLCRDPDDDVLLETAIVGGGPGPWSPKHRLIYRRQVLQLLMALVNVACRLGGEPNLY